MDGLFIIKLILSFIVGGAYAIFSTVAADKFGSKIGGLISGLPSTVLFGLLFIAWTESTQASVEATTLIPAVIGLACIFLVTYISFIKRNVWFTLFISLAVWLILAYGLILFKITNFLVSIILFFLFYAMAYIFVTYVYDIKSSKGNKIVYSPQLILMRGVLSGFVIALSVFIAKMSGPVFGGVVATFPAMFSTTLLITYFAHGPAFSSAVAKSSLFAWISTLVFVITARFTFLTLGILGGTIVSLVACYISAYYLYNKVIRHHS